MSAHHRIVIIGGGLAAARAAESARSESADASITVVAAEARPPYERPPLSKGYLLGSDDAASTITFDAAWYGAHDINLHTGVEATELDTAAHTVRAGDLRLDYDTLLLATGASPKPFIGPGAPLTGVHTLRTLHDSTVLRTAIAHGGRRIVVIGSGWIGLEVAAAAITYGNSVTVIGHGPIPLASAIGPVMGEVFADLHRGHGVDLRMDSAVSAIRGSGHVDGVVLGTGEELDADLVVVAIGATPNTTLAAASGITVDNGIVTDAGLRTSAADVFAAGDLANAYHPVLGRRLRIDHWANADKQGAAAGRALTGVDVEYDEIPYFFTDQYDLGMEYSGYGTLAAEAELVVRGDLASREFVAFWLRDRHVVAGMNVNVWDVNESVQKLIRAVVRVDPVALANPDVSLDSLLPA
ncbi:MULTISPECIES: NAD(P)/FAD-dependent oxidoreductase [unclassified Leifsonia]|uniref:NAD(P)/FAD-dependent oxidoreductase n=1 Tax=unclassified Leifsonia TaxID=2663824 RepID=UPI0006F59012|nr:MULTISPECIES: FAD-dependent oxidoreductase [unclassified Leifsonia]KQX07787.1 pyridine nucleotide-disulfide oxidoreductase [Leifsonia sp. Root1293]KRA12069.1 pyridine nucleotide-disulfide oxidoreductase [Leifsonia sp. Root60]